MKFILKMIVMIALIPNISYCALFGDLNLNSNVPVICEILVNPLPYATNLDLINGALFIKIGHVIEKCNKREGYTISAYSMNAGKLVNQTDSLIQIPYQIKYSGLTATSLDTNKILRVSPILTQKMTKTSAVRIKFLGNPNLISDNYSDTITFSISTN